jgi:hypothetical protein
MERTVFKIFGSIGPAGSILSLFEKLMYVCFYDAYELADPKRTHSKKHVEQAKELREKLVHELFEVHSEIERLIKHHKEANVE